MLEYTRIDASALLSTAVLITFAVLTGSILVRLLGSASLFRRGVNGPALAFEAPSVGQDASGHGKRPQIIGRGPTDIDLARLDDDGGGSRRAPVPDTPNNREPAGLVPVLAPIPIDSLPYEPVEMPFGPIERFHTPMIPGAREPGRLTTFGVPPIVLLDSPTTMDAATIAARQREGGGAPSERRPRRQGSRWTHFKQTLRHILIGGDRS